MAYFLDDDGDGVATIWHGTPGSGFLRPMPVLSESDIQAGFRGDVWPKIVAALTDEDESVAVGPIVRHLSRTRDSALKGVS